MLRVLIFQFHTTRVQLTYYMLLMMRIIKEDSHDELVTTIPTKRSFYPLGPKTPEQSPFIQRDQVNNFSCKINTKFL